VSTAAVIVAIFGAVLVAVGVVQVRRPWAQYQALKAQEDNIARYESWRGGLRDNGPTGASVAIELYRGQVRNAAIAIGAGVVFLLAGLFVIR
jgi:hypothetical protein